MGNEIKPPSAAQGGISPLRGRIERMMAEMCPEGVKWVKLGEVGMNLDRRRKPITASNRVSGVIPYYGASGIVDYVKDFIFNEDILLISEDGANLLSRTYPIAFSVQGKCWVNNHAHVMSFSNTSTRKYVEHYLNSIDLSPWIAAGAQPKLTKESLNNIEIPLPPLPIQEAIADILDKFDRLSVELQAELQARKQQYEYYKNKLFYNSSNWISGKISEFCTLEKGKTPIQKAVPGEYDLVVTAKERRTNNEYQFDKASAIVPLVSSRGHGVAAINEIYYQEGKFAVGNILCCITPKDDSVLSAKYLCYYLNHTKDRLIVPLMKGGANVSVTVSALSTIKIKFPSLSEQARIVSILDKFEALVNDLSQGLPAEIAAVKEQYEYYRNKLLTFDKKS